MATTPNDILARVQALGYGTDTATPQLTMVQTAYRRILSVRRWKFLETTATSTTAIGNDSVALTAFAADISLIDAVRVEVGTEYDDVDYKDTQEWRDLRHQYRDQGTPRFWTRQGTNLKLWPIPNKVYTVTLDYIKSVADPAGATALLIPDEYCDVLTWMVVMQLTFRERDWDGHNFARQMYAEVYNEMLGELFVSDRQSPTHIGKSGFFDQYDIEPDPWLM